MSNYYDYREVKVMIAHKLMSMDGWKVFGYSPDTSDSMTDYYNPASWGGVAEKNGYILCVDVYGVSEGQDIKEYNCSNLSYDKSILEKIEKLKMFTPDRGAYPQEVETAKAKIEILQKKMEKENENKEKYIVVGHIPAHMAHPPKCNWHIEKDGLIIAKGNGILKYSDVYEYFNYSQYKKNLEDFRTQSKEKYIANLASEYINKGYYSNNEKAIENAKNQYDNMQETAKLIDDFNKFVNKLDTTCGCLVGEGNLETYEKVIVTEYRTEIKAVETETGSIKDGQCFIVKTSFNYGHNKGYVYRIHVIEYEGRKSYHAYKLNGKLTKECTGNANTSNHWYITEDFIRWFEKGSLAWCELQEVKTPYEVEKIVKKTIKSENSTETNTNISNTDDTESINVFDLTYIVTEDIDTRNGEQIFLVKVKEKLNREEYLQLNKQIKSLGGYYSKFKHAFLFKENPTKLLKGSMAESEHTEEQNKQKQTEKKQDIKNALVEKIDKQIKSIQKKINGLSGDYKTNTWKRMNEQASRDKKIEGYQTDINILQYLLDTLDNRSLTPLEENLMISSFRDTIHSYCMRNEAYNSENRGTAIKPILYPQIDYELPLDGWYNQEVLTRQKRLNKANISNTAELLKAVEEYKVIYQLINKPVNQKEKKIKQLEREYKMQQKGDINFTPSEVAEQLITYAKINENSRILEPSAGIGNIADIIKQYSNNVDVCEQMYHFSELLKLKGYNVVGNDFLQYETNIKYDAIIMNPPFSDEINHIKHAFELLKDGGTLVSITSPHWTFANDKKSIEFREWLENETYFTNDLKSGTFEMTGVASKIVIIHKYEQSGVEIA